MKVAQMTDSVPVPSDDTTTSPTGKAPEECRARVGFIATRIKGTDGVSLEARKWARMIAGQRCECFFFAGELDTPDERSLEAPLAHFQHPDILAIYRASFGTQTRDPETTRQIHHLREQLKERVREFIEQFNLSLLVVENVLSLPLNIPLALAVTEVLAETGIPAIGHHHDFYWERQRMLVSSVWDYINMAFPPNIPNLLHVVINSSAAHQFSLRTGATASVIPNVLDFDQSPPEADEYATNLRAEFGIDEKDAFILQPTRIVARKGIENSVELVHRLERPGKLVISHAAGDENRQYEKRLRTYSRFLDVDTLFMSDRIGEERGTDENGRKIYALADVYPHADLVTYPSLIEGFGNAFLETIYFKKPIVVNTYSVYVIDIKPKGFKAIEIDQYVTDETLRQARQVLDDKDARQEMVETNFELARQHYSYSVCEEKIRGLLTEALGQ